MRAKVNHVYAPRHMHELLTEKDWPYSGISLKICKIQKKIGQRPTLDSKQTSVQQIPENKRKKAEQHQAPQDRPSHTSNKSRTYA